MSLTPPVPPLPPTLPAPFLLLHPAGGGQATPVSPGPGADSAPPFSLATAHPSLASWFNAVPTCASRLPGGCGLESLSYLKLTNGPALLNFIRSSLRVRDLVSEVHIWVQCHVPAEWWPLAVVDGGSGGDKGLPGTL